MRPAFAVSIGALLPLLLLLPLPFSDGITLSSASASTSPLNSVIPLLFKSRRNDLTSILTSDGHVGSSILPPPFPSHSVNPTLDPYPIHVSLQSSETETFNFDVKPSVSLCGARLRDATTDLASASNNSTSISDGPVLVSFDWVRNRTVAIINDKGTTHMDRFEVTWTYSLPSWLKYIPRIASASSDSTDNGFTLELSALTINGSNTTYSTSNAIVIQFVAVVQYQCQPPIIADMFATQGSSTASTNSDATSSSTIDSQSTTAAPLNSNVATPAVIEEIQVLSILVTLSVLPPFAQRQQELASSYLMIQSPSLLNSGVRFTNHIPSQSVSSSTTREVDIAAAKFGRNDEVVFDCSSATCNLCARAADFTIAADSSSSLSSFCSFPRGSFVSTLSGVVSAKQPISVQGALEVHAGAVLEIDHDFSFVEAAYPSARSDSPLQRQYLRNQVSVIHNIDSGSSGVVINEGIIRVKRGHLVLYSPCIGRGKIEVHEGATVEFVSVLPDGSAWIFNQSDVNEAVSIINAPSTRPARRLLQIDNESTTAANDTEVVNAVTPLSLNVSDATDASNTAANSNVSSSSSTTDSPNATLNLMLSSTGYDTGNSWSSTSQFNLNDELASTTATSVSVEFETSGSQPISSTASAEVSSDISNSIFPIDSNHSDSQIFQPHSLCSLISYGGGVLFSHGLFEFHSPFQSSRSASNSDPSDNNIWNRLVIASPAAVRFMSVVDRSSTSTPLSSSDSVSPIEHLLSFNHLYLAHGVLQVGREAHVNISDVLFFQVNGGLLHFEPGSHTVMRLSDNAEVNHVAGSNSLVPQRMNTDQVSELRNVMQSMQQLWIGETESMSQSSAPLDSNGTESTNTETSDIPSIAATEAIRNPSPAFQSVMEILHSDSTADSSMLNVSPSINSGGVGALIEGFLSFESGTLGFSSGLIAQNLGHLFLRKGTQWIFDLPSSSSSRSEDSVISINCIEFSLDGILSIRRGSLQLFTPLLQIEGHGQLKAVGHETTVLIDNTRINREVYIQSLTGQSVEAIGSQLVENEEAQTNPDTGLYSLVPANSSAATMPSNETNTLPTTLFYRENLIAPCLMSNPCQSWWIGEGAQLHVAPLTILHFLPHTQVVVDTTISNGASVILDSGVRYTGRRFIQNSSVSDLSIDSQRTDIGSSATLPTAIDAPSVLLASVHIGNESRLVMHRHLASILNNNESDLASPAEVRCFIGVGNLTGNGYLSCGSSTIHLDSTLVAPTFHSRSTFSPIVSIPSDERLLNQSAPSLKFGSDVHLTSKTITSFDAVATNQFSSILVHGSMKLDGALTINIPTMQWPFPLTATATETQSSVDSNSTQTSYLLCNSSTIPCNASGVRSAILIRATLGLLPVSSPQHFSQIHFGSLFDLLPFGWNIDLDYARANLSLTDIISATSPMDSGNVSTIDSASFTSLANIGAESNVIEVEQMVILKAFSSDYVVRPHASILSNTTNAVTHLTAEGVWRLLAFLSLLQRVFM